MKQTAVSQGLRIVYEDAGQGSPAIVLTHGAFLSRTDFGTQVEHLAQRHRVLALDLRGHGESDKPKSGYRLRDFAQDVIAVCEEAGLDRYVLCGHSMPVALVAASLRPDRVAGVALLDPAMLFPESMRTQVLNDFVPVLEGEGWVQAMQGYIIGRAIGPYDSPGLKTMVSEAIARAPHQMAAPLWRDIYTSDDRDLLRGEYPLLYVHARMPSDLVRLRELRPDVFFAAVAGSGHFLHLEVPDQVNAMLDRFLHIVESVSSVAGREYLRHATSGERSRA